MSTPFLLVFLSAFTHAYWNYLLKRSGGTQAFVALSKVCEAVVLLPLLLIVARPELPLLLANWHLPVVGAVLVLANYYALTAAYRSGELSFVYPVSRAAILVFLPPLAYFTLHEHPSKGGLFAIGLVIVGIILLTIPELSVRALRRFAHAFATPAAAFSLLALLSAACYTIWDKSSIQTLKPFTYFATYTVLVAVMYTFAVARTQPRHELTAEWSSNCAPIIAVALLNSFSYLLVLVALRTTTSSYVIAARQLSIAIGAVLGWRWLGERLPRHKAIGIGVLVVACLLVAFLTH